MKNKIIGGLIIATAGLFITAALMTGYSNLELKANLFQLGLITGFSAIATRFLIKEKN